MTIRSRLNMVTFFSFLIVLFFVGLRLYVIRETEILNRGHMLANGITVKAFNLNLATQEYLLTRTPRSRGQLQASYNSLGKFLKSSSFSIPSERLFLKQIIKGYEAIGVFFTQLIDNQEEPGSQILSKVKNIVSQSSRLLEMTNESTHVKEWRVNILYAGLLILFLVFITFNTLWLGRSILKSIQQLYFGAEIIAKGNLDHRIGMQGKDELSRFGQIFDQMIENLKKITISKDALSKEILERNKVEEKLKEKIMQLEEFHQATIGRELRMKELREEIAKLKAAKGE